MTASITPRFGVSSKSETRSLPFDSAENPRLSSNLLTPFSPPSPRSYMYICMPRPSLPMYCGYNTSPCEHHSPHVVGGAAIAGAVCQSTNIDVENGGRSRSRGGNSTSSVGRCGCWQCNSLQWPKQHRSAPILRPPSLHALAAWMPAVERQQQAVQQLQRERAEDVRAVCRRIRAWKRVVAPHDCTKHALQHGTASSRTARVP